MTKQRYNVSEVAELLLQEMDSFKASAERLKSTTIKVDEKSLEEFRSLVDYQERLEKQADEKRRAFLDDLSRFEAKRRYRLPNGLTYTLIALLVVVMAFSAYAWSQLKDLNYLKSKVEYYEAKDSETN